MTETWRVVLADGEVRMCDGVRLCLDAIRALDLAAVVRGAP